MRRAFGGVLNIGKLGPGAGAYYVGEIATSAEDYYTGRGEARGRWVGSLREVLGVDGPVDPEHFRRVLAGERPLTGEALVWSQGSAGRAAARRGSSRSDSALDDHVDSVRAAAILGVSHQHVRRLLKAGSEYAEALRAAGPGDVVQEPRRYLMGEHVASASGKPAWSVPRAEVERLAADRPDRKPRPGYDVTLRPPKSVSIVWALAEPSVRTEIRQAHADAVDEVVRYLESAAVRGRVSIDKRQRVVETDGVIAAAFDHRTSRAGDPLLHTHVVVANMTRVDGADGPVWRAIAAHGLFEHSKAAGHLYQAHLRHRLSQRLGVEWKPITNGYADIDGVPTEVVELFSKRRSEIAEVLAESGNSSARAAQIATLKTRKPKDYGVDPDTLFDQWRTEAAEAGFDSTSLPRVLGRHTPTRPTAIELGDIIATMAGPKGLTEYASTFRRSDVIQSLSVHLVDRLPARDIELLADRFLSSSHCVLATAAPDRQPTDQTKAAHGRARRTASTQATFTTAQLVGVEDELLRWTTDTRHARTAPLPEELVDDELNRRPEMSREQAEMVRAVCSHGDPVLPVSGRPGAGKTYATEAIVAAHCAAGIPIVGCAVSAAAAAEMESAAGFARSMAPATTVSKLLIDLDRWGRLAPRSVVVVDEASMVPTRELHRLLAHTRMAQGSLVLIGDPDQHGAVEVGGAFQRLCRDRGERLVELVENNRQVEAVDRLSIEEYRDGHIVDALSRMDNASRVVRSRTAGESFDAMVADWYADHLDGGADPMIAGPNSTRLALNERARVLLKEHGELGGDPVIAGGREFLVGDHVVARRNDRRLRSPSGSDFVKNGSAGVIEATHPDECEVTVRFEREGQVRVPQSYLAGGRLEHGYARTSYGVQGSTHRVARYHPTDQSSFEEGYVSITRGTESNRLYIVDGSIGTGDDEAHARPSAQRFDLDDITVALTRRRSGSMAADLAPLLADVHRMASTRSLGDLQRERARLARSLSGAPPDRAEVIETVQQELDALHVRRDVWAGSGVDQPRLELIDRAIGSTADRLRAAEAGQSERDGWIEERRPLVDRLDLVTRAERDRRTRIAANPVEYASQELLDALGGEPLLQGERRRWRARLVETVTQFELSPGSAPGSLGAEPEW